MKKYQVKIDGEVASQTYTLDEMLELGLLDDYDENIKIKLFEESVWQVARDYPFHISEANSSGSNFVVNNDGTVTRKNSNKNNGGYTIDEYGQIKRRGNSTQDESSTDTNNTTVSRTSQSNTIDDDNSGCIWAVIIAIGIIVLAAIL